MRSVAPRRGARLRLWKPRACRVAATAVFFASVHAVVTVILPARVGRQPDWQSRALRHRVRPGAAGSADASRDRLLASLLGPFRDGQPCEVEALPEMAGTPRRWVGWEGHAFRPRGCPGHRLALQEAGSRRGLRRPHRLRSVVRPQDRPRDRDRRATRGRVLRLQHRLPRSDRRGEAARLLHRRRPDGPSPYRMAPRRGGTSPVPDLGGAFAGGARVVLASLARGMGPRRSGRREFGVVAGRARQPGRSGREAGGRSPGL